MGLISNGTTVFDAGSMSLGGSMVFMKKLTASSSATLSFVDGSGGVDFSTYKEYLFTFNNIHPDGDQRDLTFNGSIDSGSNYNVTKTTTWFEALHWEDASAAQIGYGASLDLAQSTAFQTISSGLGNANDDSCNGFMHLFNPSSTTFVKHFTCTSSFNYRIGVPGEVSSHVAGYFNTTSAVDAVQFKMESGNVDAGTICLYGIS
jgi:hypothetical protein